MTVPALPKMYLLRQEFPRPAVADISREVGNQMARVLGNEKIKPGETVAITAGSRGIRGIDTVTKSVVDNLKGLGARPFIFPAMGSHGGGTAEGQRGVLAGFGITEDSMGCEIKATMDVVEVGKTSLGMPVFVDRYAAEADHIAVINRVKPHTKLIGSVESGLLKMCLIGMGKREGAKTYHRAIDRYSWQKVVESVSDALFSSLSIAFGLAILQNAYEEIGKIAVLAPDEFGETEPLLLQEARNMMGSLPFKDVDLLIIDEMGKEISGTGMDTNITGRKEGSPMKVVRVFVRDLTVKTKGNAQGIGLADFTTKRLVDSIDYHALYLNSQTAYRTDSCKIPMHFSNDMEVMRTALEMAGITDPAEYKVIWIKNTMEMETLMASEAYSDRFYENKNVCSVEGPHDIIFDKNGNIISAFSHNV